MGSIAATPVSSGRSVSELRRFFAKVEFGSDGCWLWRGALYPKGYGRFEDSGLAHRWLCKALRWDPGELALDHLCRVRNCVNVFDHLEPVPIQVNMARSLGASAVNARKAECAHGHPFTEENTRIKPNGQRECRICRREEKHRYRKRRRDD